MERKVDGGPLGRPQYMWVVAVGANIGERLENLRGARRALVESDEVVAASSLYESAPMYEVDQPAFMNAVVLVRSYRTAEEMLTRLQEVEREGGRTRDKARRYGPRSIDLDVVAGWETSRGVPVIVQTERLQIPHPRMHERPFVVVPFGEVCSDWEHPLLHIRLEELKLQFAGTDDLVPVATSEEWQ